MNGTFDKLSLNFFVRFITKNMKLNNIIFLLSMLLDTYSNFNYAQPTTLM